jgi:hypothetical protein
MLDPSELQRVRVAATFGVLGRASCDLLFGHIDALEREAERLHTLYMTLAGEYHIALVEAERLRAALDGHHAAWATKWENCSICRALAGTEADCG